MMPSRSLPPRRGEQPAERVERWRNRLTSAGVAEDHLDDVIGLMGMMFPRVQRDISLGNDAQSVDLRRGIGNIDYFDRYLVFEVPADDLSEYTFDTALGQLADGVNGTETDELLLRLREDTQRVTRRIQQRRTSGAPLPRKALLMALAQQYGYLEAPPQGVFGILTGQRAVEYLASDLLSDLPEGERPTVLKNMAATPDGAALGAWVLSNLTRRSTQEGAGDDEAPAPAAWSVEARSPLSQEISRHLSHSAPQNAEDLTEQDVTLLWAWRHTLPAVAREWVNERLDQGWQAAALLTRLLPDNQKPFPIIDHDTLSSLDALFGLDELYRRLGGLLDDPAQTDNDHLRHILEALENHRQGSDA